MTGIERLNRELAEAEAEIRRLTALADTTPAVDGNGDCLFLDTRGWLAWVRPEHAQIRAEQGWRRLHVHGDEPGDGEVARLGRLLTQAHAEIDRLSTSGPGTNGRYWPTDKAYTTPGGAP